MSRFLVSTLLLTSLFFAEAQPGSGFFSIKGRVVDSATIRPMEYVNIALYRVKDSSLVTGAITNEQGYFEITRVENGIYYMDLRFMGFETMRINRVIVEGQAVNLGQRALIPAAINLGEVVVEGKRSALTYQIDKKVINVDEMTTAISGSAADVLATVPSVKVDIEGNVTLRGSGSFTVLVDGRPSILDPQDALQQIPASTIESIEIITNPSAKYNPEGTAGIINIRMKKQERRGWSGLVNANAGLNEKYGGDILAEQKNESVSTLLAIDYNNRMRLGTSESEERYDFQGATSTIRANGDMRMLRRSFGIRGGIEFQLADNDALTFSGRYGARMWQRNASLLHTEFTSIAPDPNTGRNIIHRERAGSFAALSGGYHHSFGAEEHKLSADVDFRYNDSDELTTSELFSFSRLTGGKKTTEVGPSRDFNTRVEYTLPFGENGKFEAGYHGEFDLSEEGTTLSEIDTLSGQFVLLPQYNNNVNYDEREHAVYSLYSNEWDSFGFQAGLRAEYTDRTIRLTQGDEFVIDRWDFFPTIHASYKFLENHEIMASYTRRIERPRGWELEPFETWIDASNVRKGNPGLTPEFIDSYELAAQTLVGQATLSMELYHRVGSDKIEDIRSVYSDNVTLTTFGNVGKEFSSGVEFLANFDIVKGWNVNIIGDIYDFRFEGTIFNEPFSKKSFNGSARFNNLVKIGNSTQFQLNAGWESPSVTPQGREEGYVSVDVAARQEFMSKQLSLTLQVQNILGTARHESAAQGLGFSSFSKHVMESPMVMLTARWSINKQNNEREQQRENGNGFGQEEF